MSVREAVDTTSKAFATGGEDFAYYLNESRAMVTGGSIIDKPRLRKIL